MRANLLLNADDFGASHLHNIAVEEACSVHAINSASLMVGQPGTAEATEIAHRHPALEVGLHVALSKAVPVSPPETIPLLVGPQGLFHEDETALWRAGLSSAGRHQIRTEVKAQFTAFAQTGLRCAHVNTHRHCHLLPHVALALAAELRRRRVLQSRIPAYRFEGWSDAVRFLRYHSLTGVLRAAGVRRIYKAIWYDWDADTLLRVLRTVPSRGFIELVFHPVACREHPFGADLPTLCEPAVLAAIGQARGARTP